MDPHHRFLTVLSPPSLHLDSDLDENDLFWSGDFSDHPPPAFSSDLLRHDSPGILAALTEGKVLRRPIVSRKAMVFGLTREEEREYSQSVPARKFFHSSPVSVPVATTSLLKGDLDEDETKEREEEMLPPHEIVAKGSLMMDNTTFSVLEGVGRTLKGRDLRQVRNTVWRQTGFLD